MGKELPEKQSSFLDNKSDILHSYKYQFILK